VSAADELYQRLIAPIEKTMIAVVARTVCDPEDAQDVFQEALAVIWRKLPAGSRRMRERNSIAGAGILPR
jgi:DNA-directed RNA polymerase specialized sigma24 family protein